MATVSTPNEADRKSNCQSRLMKSHAHSRRLVDGLSQLRPDRDVKHGDINPSCTSVLRPDVQVIVGTETFWCHRFVLVLSSSYFRCRLREIDETPPSDEITAVNVDDGTVRASLRRTVVNLEQDNSPISISPPIFEKIIDFIYTGSVELTGGDVVDVYLASNQLDLDHLSAICVDYMITTLSADNCIRYWTFADTPMTKPPVPTVPESMTRLPPQPYTNDNIDGVGEVTLECIEADKSSVSPNEGKHSGFVEQNAGRVSQRSAIRSELSRLAEACCVLVQTEFDRVTFRPDFGDLTRSMIESILNGTKLRVKSEVDICEMIIRWLAAQNCHREDARRILPQQPDIQLWRLVRWTGIHIDYIRTVLLGNEVVHEDADAMDFLSRVVGFLESGTQFYGLRTFHRVSTGLERCIMAFGIGDGLQSGCAQGIYRIHIQQIDATNRVSADGFGSSRGLESPPSSDRVVTVSERGPSTSLSSWPTLQREAAACCTPSGAGATTVYLSGLGRQCSELWTWSVAAGWTRCGDMVVGRSRHGACYVGGRVYSIGGIHRGATISSIEYYDPVSNVGRLAAGFLASPLKNLACVSYRSIIYVFGGLNDKERAMADVQIYDTSRDVCTILVGSSMPRPVGYCRAAVYGHCALVISRSTCFVYDLDAEQWTERRRCATGVRQFGLAVENGRIYVVGGAISEPGTFGTVRTTLVDEVKSLPVSAAVIGDQIPVWKNHFRLPKSGIVSAFAVVTLPS